METPSFRIRFPSRQALLQVLKEQLSMGGLFLRCDQELLRGALVELTLIAPDGAAFAVPAAVLQVIAGQGLALTISQEGNPALSALAAHAAGLADDASRNQAGELMEILPAEEAMERPAPADPSLPLSQQLETMSVAQKRHMALHGTKDQRLHLIRDRNKTLHVFVLKNPSITLDEVEQIARTPTINPDALREIAGHREWTRSTAVCRNLVRNPQTPTKEALRLLERLPASDIRALAKTGNVRTAIQQAARKKLAQSP